MSASPAIALVLDRPPARSRRHRDPADETAHHPGAWWLYATEILDHLRLPYRTMSRIEPEALTGALGVLVIAHPQALDPATYDDVDRWVRAGGSLICVGDPGGLAELVGAGASGVVEHDHVHVHDSEVWTDRPDVPLHAVGGVHLRETGSHTDADTVLATWDDGTTAGTLRRVGNGVAIGCGVDVWQSVVRVQQGVPVTRDGVPAPDGSAPVDDGILKCEDGMVLDVTTDRALPPDQPARPGGYEHVLPPASGLPMFHRPQADLWRSFFLQCVWWAAEQAGVAVPWLHYWPAGVPAVAHLSHDADLNDDEHAQAALDVFDEAGVQATWCQLFPGGYSPAIYAAITAAGHEQALHYNAMGDADIATWGWPQIRAQYAWAQAVTGVERIVSNKNHYTRWEGYTEFYRWCEELGLRIDESRGPSKQGTVGFPFGTTHVSFPLAPAADGYRYYDVLTLPLHTQDLAFAAHESVRDVIIDNALAQHGVAHFLFHGPHLHRHPAVRKACLELVQEARRRGMPWWTSERVNEWERARRDVELAVHRTDDGWRVESVAAAPVRGSAILLLLPGAGTSTLVSGDGTVTTVRRHGREFVELAADIPAGTASWTLRVRR